MEEEDFFLYAGYFKEVSGKNIGFDPHVYTVWTKSSFQVRHVVLRSGELHSEDVVLVITNVPIQCSARVQRLYEEQLSTVVTELLQRCGPVKIEMDGPFVPDPEFVKRRPEIVSQMAYRLTNGAKAISEDVAYGERSGFEVIKSDKSEG